MTPKMKVALAARIQDNGYKLNWHTERALVRAGWLADDGMATNAGIEKSGLPFDRVYLMILGADTAYASTILPKGTEVMVTWRTREKNGKRREYVTGYIMNGDKLAEVRLYVSPRHTFETRVTPRLTDPSGL